ncbi:MULTISPECIES: cytochrome P450 [unclassified Streptomyces]|uniref:cytochrome P450 n=1 Tax=unclassified Streptomyces TaxID=2593676 RepID=UPI00324E889F
MTETQPEPAAFPMPRATGCPFDPAPGYRQLQAEQPIARVRQWDGAAPWLVTGHADARALLADPRFSVETDKPGHPHPSPATKQIMGSPGMISRMDDPEHGRLRRMVTREFTVRRVESMRQRIQAITDDLIDGILAGPNPTDLVEKLALPIPSLVICELLGVPYEDREFFQRTTSAFVMRSTTVEQAKAAMMELLDRLDQLVTEKAENPGDDLLSRLVVERLEKGEITREVLVGLTQLLLSGGYETTANMIALGIVALLQHPEQLAVLRDTEDPKVVANAVDELLRYLTVPQMGARRAALVDADVNGHPVRQGEGVIISIATANRDSTVYPDPDVLDIGRDTGQHLAFGHGIHQCVGAPLARLELQIVYRTLFRRVPSLRLAVGFDQLPFKHDGLLNGLYELPVAW